MAKTKEAKGKQRYKALLQRPEAFVLCLQRSDTQHLFGSDWKYRFTYSPRHAEVLFHRAYPNRPILQGPFLDK